MPDTLTASKSLTIQTIGGNANTWGTIANANFTAIDQALGVTLQKALTGDATLTSTEAKNLGYDFTGALSANAAVTFPAFKGPIYVRNQTTGGYAITIGMATGGTVRVGTARNALLYCDGTDFFVPGNIGTYFSNFVPFGSALPLVSELPGNIASINLPAGDWDVRGYIGFAGNAATQINYLIGSVSSVSAAIDPTPGRYGSQVYSGATPLNYLSDMQFACGHSRFSLSALTTVYLTVVAGFAAAPLNGFGTIEARLFGA